VLPAAFRMRRSADFSSVVRSGDRVRRGCLVVHVGTPEPRRVDAPAPSPEVSGTPLVGLVVGRSVGGSVVRHRVSRRLRAVAADRLTLLPPGSGTVIRALPGAAEAPSVRLAADLDAALERLLGRRR
jgi:ribonuclease P protein component